MSDHDVERMLESTDLSNRSKIRNSLRRDLLDRDPRRAPRGAWVLNAFALGVMAVGVIVFGALVLSGGGGIMPGSGGQQAESTPELPTSTPSDADPAGGVMPSATIVPYHHVVQEGETLLSIVQQYGWEDATIFPTVLQMNGLTSEDEITVGMTLLIPPRIVEPPFEPCPAGYNPGVPPTMVPGHEVPSSETATPFPTAIPCNPGTVVYDGGSGVVGPNSDITATPLPFDPAAPTVPPAGFMLPTPTPADPTIESIEELSALLGFEVQDLASVPAGYELLGRGGQMYTSAIKGAITTYIRRASAMSAYIQLRQIEPVMSLPEVAGALNIDVTQAADVEVGDQPALWLEDHQMPTATNASNPSNVLIWTTDAFSYTLIADDLTLDEMIMMAEALE